MKNVQIIETFKSNLVVNESTDGLIHMTGLFGETGTRNRNGRVYSKENYSEMVESLQPEIERGLLGELNHPYNLSIDLNNVSHKIDKIQMNEDGTCTGEITILSTPKGDIVKSLIEAGLPIYVSSRGAGQIDEDGNVTLTRLVTWDIVSQPSVVNARFDVKEGLYENIDENLLLISEAEKEDEEEKEPEETKEEEKEPEEEPKKEDPDQEETKEEEEPKKEDPKEEEEPEKEPEEEPKDENLKKPEEKEEIKNESVEENTEIIKEDKNIRSNKMNKHFYLAEAFRSAINHKPFNEDLTNIFQEANDEMKNAEITLEGGMMNVIPFGFISEAEDAPAWPIQGHELNATVDDTHGKALVHTQYNNPLMPIMNDEILGEFTWFTGLRGTFATNRFGAAKAYWKGELKKADPTKMKFDAIEAKPKRLTTYIDISRQELIQSDYNLETYIRTQLAEAITLKLQETILGDGAGDDVTPQGLFYNATELNALSFANLVNVEKQAKLNGVRRATKYFVSPDIEATLRTTLKDQVAGAQYILDNDRILGKEYVANEDIAGIAYGDPKSVAICVWGPGVVVNFNPYSLDLYDAYRFTVNMYVDVLYLNPLKGEEDNATAVPQLLPFVLGE